MRGERSTCSTGSSTSSVTGQGSRGVLLSWARSSERRSSARPSTSSIRARRPFRTTTSTAARNGCSSVAGRPTLRDPEGEHELRPGDVVVFPEGPAGAHQLRNGTDEPIRVLIFSTKGLPNSAVYPDSGKIGIWTGDEADPPRLFQIGSAVDYWDGEGSSKRQRPPRAAWGSSAAALLGFRRAAERMNAARSMRPAF